MRIEQLQSSSKLRVDLLVRLHKSERLIALLKLGAPLGQGTVGLAVTTEESYQLFYEEFESTVHHFEIVDLLRMRIEALKELRTHV